MLYLTEEAVNEVKRQAVSELQKAVAAAEQKANEMVNAERAKLDRAVLEARRQAAEEAVSLVNHQDDSSEVSIAILFLAASLHLGLKWEGVRVIQMVLTPSCCFPI